MKMPVVFNENPVFLCKFKSHEKRRSRDLLKRLLQLLAACMVISCISAFGQENTSVKINPGHNGAWFNPTTSGQGFLLDVMPETNLAFLLVDGARSAERKCGKSECLPHAGWSV